MHMDVIWRRRAVVGTGLVLAFLLAFFSLFRVSFDDGLTVSYRQGQTWQATETVLVDQPGGLYVTAQPGPSANPAWLASLTSLYAQIANSATIRSRVFPGGIATKRTGDYRVSQVIDQSNAPLAVLTFDGTAATPDQSVGNAHRASFEFRSYIASQAAGSNVSGNRRVVVHVLSPASARTAKVVAGRKLTVPILVFLAVLLVALGLAYVLENLAPKRAAAPSRKEPARPRMSRSPQRLPEAVETTTQT